MNITTIPIKNLKRKLLRTILLVAVFILGILSMVALNNISAVVGEGLEMKMNQFGANILVYPKTDQLKVSYGGFELGSMAYDVKYLTESSVVSSIKNIELRKNISSVAPKLLSVAKLGGQAVGVVGVDWDEETQIKSFWAVDGALPREPEHVLIGSRVAAQLAVTSGQDIRFHDRVFRVTGVLEETGSEDDNVIFMNLHLLQRMSGKEDLINYVEVAALCSACPIDDIVRQISDRLPGTDIRAIQQLVKQRMSAVGFVRRLAFAVSVVILLTACFMIALFMFASVNERKKEIGLLRSLGYSKFQVFYIFCIEALIIGLVSGFFGYLLGYYVSIVLARVLAIDQTAILTFNTGFFLFTVAAVAAVAVVAASIPALKASRIEPSEALVTL
jgi:putative ABC transport system permease protein